MEKVVVRVLGLAETDRDVLVPTLIVRHILAVVASCPRVESIVSLGFLY